MFNLDTDKSRRLTEEEVKLVREAVPSLNDPQTAAWYSDRVECINGKP